MVEWHFISRARDWVIFHIQYRLCTHISICIGKCEHFPTKKIANFPVKCEI